MAGIPRSLPELLKRAIAGKLSMVHVALPGQVVAYDATKNLADVQVMVQQSVWDDDNGRTYEDVGTLAGVPVVWPRAGGFKMTLPMAVGDTGLLVFCSDSTGEWRLTGQSSQPQDAERLGIGWPVFIPGFTPDIKKVSASDPASTKAIWGSDGGNGQIRATASTLEFGPNPTSPIALATPLDAWIALVCAAFTTISANGTASAAAMTALAAAMTALAAIPAVAAAAAQCTASASAATAAAATNTATVATATAAAAAPTIDSTLVKSL